jgi:5-oxoprolinase (ATP-hydrolysing) subunit A
MSHLRADLNADVGEAFGPYTLGQDPAIVPLVTSVNVACGFHAGDPAVMRETVVLAREHQVAVGAHPGFPDLVGFGRRQMHLSPREVEDLVVYQIGALAAVAGAQGVALQHVKPHGALYNMASNDLAMADAIARAIVAVDRALILVGLSGSKLVDAGRRAGLRTASEVFADRGYRSDGSLLPRDAEGAVMRDLEVVRARAVTIVQQGSVTADDGRRVLVQPETICLHGDTPGAADMARAIRTALQDAGVALKALGAR